MQKIISKIVNIENVDENTFYFTWNTLENDVKAAMIISKLKKKDNPIDKTILYLKRQRYRVFYQKVNVATFEFLNFWAEDCLKEIEKNKNMTIEMKKRLKIEKRKHR